MPKVSKESASPGGDPGLVVERSEDLEDYSVNFVTFREDIDHTPLLRGLPDDQCQSPHWGYVLKGRLTFRFGDREEVFEAGDAFYAPPGHIPVHNQPGSEYLQFSPAAELRKTSAIIMQNMQAMQAG
jgi:mannose-6-phosphate isomerase-like protein (cupin superfamily)